MIKDITLGQYIPGDSVLHRADPRTKMLSIVLYTAVVLTVNSYMGYTLVLLFTLLAVRISGIPFKYTLKGLKPVLFIAVFTAVINIFFTGGGTLLFQYAFIRISYEGLGATLRMIFRLSTLVIGASLLTFTTTPIRLTDGIENLMAPLKRIGVPIHEMAMMMTIALRFIPTLLEETEKIIKAQAARGADFDTGNFIKRAKSYMPVLIPLFVSAFRRADELAVAMEARCYRGGVGRTRLRQLEITRLDYGLAAVVLFFAAVIWLLEASAL